MIIFNLVDMSKNLQLPNVDFNQGYWIANGGPEKLSLKYLLTRVLNGVVTIIDRGSKPEANVNVFLLFKTSFA